MTQFLTTAQVVALHDAEKACPLLDRGKLESAVGQPSQTWAGAYLYPTLIEQAAVLLFGICNAHAFEDANKRTAWLACATFLDMNGVELLEVDEDEVVDLMVCVADRGWETPDIVTWLLDRV